MCFSAKSPAISKEDPKTPARSDAAQKAATDNRRRAAEQQGAVSNIFTSALGDVGYGSSAQRQVVLGGGTQ